MYDFVDRSVVQLGPGGRFLLWAMRGWIHSASKGSCPPGALAPAFARHGVLPALPHIHRLLAEMNRRAQDSIAFLPLNYGKIGEDEAVLLQMWRDATEDPSRAEATLRLLLVPEAVGDAFTALLAATDKLRAGALDIVDLPVEAVKSARD